MQDGKRSLLPSASSTHAIERANEGTESPSIHCRGSSPARWKTAKPRVEVKSRRVGGATYQVPLEVSLDRRPHRVARHALARRMQPADREGTPMHVALWPTRSRTPATNQGAGDPQAGRRLTRWRRPTAPSPISAGKPSRISPFPLL